jgi:hypothetical protein
MYGLYINCFQFRYQIDVDRYFCWSKKHIKIITYEPNFVVNDCTVHTFQISFYVLLLCFPFVPSKASWKCAVPTLITWILKKNSYCNRENWAFSYKILSRGGGRIWTHNLRFNLPWELPGNPVPLFDLLHKVGAKLLSLPRMLLLEPVRGGRQASHALQECTAGKSI